MKSYTLKNIPDATYARLKESAEKKGTSINQEMLEILVRFAPPSKEEVEGEVTGLREWIEQLAKKGPTPTVDEIVEMVRESRR